jgi:peptidoglycan/LPS O-acetylase OafA/YrhL
MLRSIIPAWLVAVLTALWAAATALVESGAMQEGTWPYVVAAALSAGLAGIVGGVNVIKAKRQQVLDAGPLEVREGERTSLRASLAPKKDP